MEGWSKKNNKVKELLDMLIARNGEGVGGGEREYGGINGNEKS